MCFMLLEQRLLAIFWSQKLEYVQKYQFLGLPHFGGRSWLQFFQVTLCTVVNGQWFLAHVCRVDSMPLSRKLVFSLGETEADMHCSVKCPGRPPLVSFFWRPPYVTFWYQTSSWCNYWGLTLTLHIGNVIPFPVHHWKLHCMLMVLPSKNKAFLLCICTWVNTQVFHLHLERITNVISYLCYIYSMLHNNLRKWHHSAWSNTSNQNLFCCWACGFHIHTGSVQECYCIPATLKPKRKKRKIICTIELKYTPT